MLFLGNFCLMRMCVGGGSEMRRTFCIAVIMIVCNIYASMVFAMQFSQPEKLGYFYGSAIGGFGMMGESQNNGKEYIPRVPGKYDYSNLYGKGTALFGEGDSALYWHYDFYQYHRKDPYEGKKWAVRVGGKNIENTYDLPILLYEAGYDIYRLTSDNGLVLYLLRHSSAISAKSFQIFGWYEGKFYRYIDSDRLTDMYFSKQRNRYTIPSYELYNVSGDTLIFQYSTESGAKGEFRFKWDENAQWFSVEQVAH